jgi:hypothetical protein
MTRSSRVAALAVAMCLLVAGPFAPLAAAQQPAAPPAQQPAAPAPQPEVFQEALKPAPALQRDGVVLSENSYDLVAGLTNIFLFPGRIITCTLGTGLSVGVLALTFGTGYRAAAAAVEEGCGGKWAVTGADLMPDRPPIPRPGERRY